jgi:uncharacterized membrane protein
MKQLTKWERFERISKILQLIILIVGVTALLQIPYQIKQNRQAVDKNTFDILWKLDTRLREGLNAKIYLAIEHNRPVLTKKITTDDLDIYLADLSSIEDARERDLISDEDVYSWFWDNIVDTYENKEVKAYITTLQKEDSEYYKDFVNLYNRVQQYSRLQQKK